MTSALSMNHRRSNTAISARLRPVLQKPSHAPTPNICRARNAHPPPPHLERRARSTTCVFTHYVPRSTHRTQTPLPRVALRGEPDRSRNDITQCARGVAKHQGRSEISASRRHEHEHERRGWTTRSHSCAPNCRSGAWRSLRSPAGREYDMMRTNSSKVPYLNMYPVKQDLGCSFPRRTRGRDQRAWRRGWGVQYVRMARTLHLPVVIGSRSRKRLRGDRA